MDYEIITMKERITVGLSARTSNSSPDMNAVIGGLWKNFFEGGIYESIPDKKSDGKSFGIYSDYESDKDGEYTITVSCEVDKADCVPEGTIVRTIPAGRYARFIVVGDMVKAVGEFWQKLWSMDLDRSYICDYEEYQNSDMENAEIHMYISLKD